MTLRDARIKSGLSQKQLGAIVGISQQSLQAIETGKTGPSFQTLSKLSQVLEIPVEEIVNEVIQHSINRENKRRK